jgi:hypothetical protein
MKLPIKLLFITLILNKTTASSQTKLKTQSAMETDQIDYNKSQILAITRQLTQLMIDRDTIELNKILDTHFTLTHITGYVQSKEEWFSEIVSERMKYYSYKEVKTSVEINGNKATFIGQNVLDARIWGTRNNWHLQQTMHLQNRNGKWIILKSIATTF